ncbi:TraB/GumN family protein [Chitinophaga vietnamensis]|uniref:TraB/GumN family protein n=1 Tax=Chitinophaga vietnamensis TaxID=2593957 RepID=UPI0011776F3E|nr:TraB/GumN family protein [Chitinophaga vietnamensis]
MKKTTLLCLACAISISLFAQQSSLLWKISGKGLQQPSWLYGTMHLLCKGEMIFPPAAATAFNNAKTLYMEVDLSDPQTTAKMQALMMMPDPYSFRQLFDTASYNELHQYLLDSLHMESAALDHAKPFLFTTLLTMKLGGCDEIESPERILMAKASAMHKPMAGLETLEAQMKIFDDIPDTAEVRMLMNVIHGQQKSKQQFAIMKQAYLKQDISELTRLIADEPEMAPYRNIMIDDRNRNWIPIIEKQIQSESTFIACGAGHLGGTNGVIELLRKKGYKVEPVK